MKLIVLETTENIKFTEEIDVLDCSEINACTGCAGCWVKTPGTCVIDDKASEYAKKITNYEEITIVSKLCFGGVSYKIKRVIDRCIGYVDTFMILDGNDIRHGRRYNHSFKLNVVFYGIGSDLEKEKARSLIDRMCKNYFIEEYMVEFVTSFENAFILLGGRKIDPNFVHDTEVVLPKFDNPEVPKSSIALINASPKGKRSSSQFYMDKLIEICKENSEEIKLDIFHWNSSRPINADEIMQFTMYDSIVFFFGVFVDTLPSHITQNFQRIDAYLFHYMKNHTYGRLGNNIRNTKIYAVVNCGLKYGHNCQPSIDFIKFFSEKNNFRWVKGIGIGSGPLYSMINRNMFEKDSNSNTYLAFNEFCKSVYDYSENVEYKDIITDGEIDIVEYKDIINKIWEGALKKNKLL